MKQSAQVGPIDFDQIRVSSNPVEDLRFRIRHNLVTNHDEALKKLKLLEAKKAS